MDLIQEIKLLPEHLFDKIVLEVNPKLIHLFPEIDNQIPKNYVLKWYSDFPTSTYNQHKNSLIMSLRKKYYHLFESLFRDYLDQYKLDEDSLNSLFKTSALIGDIDYLNRFIKLGANEYNGALNNGVEGGNLEVVNLILKITSKDYEFAYSKVLASAARGGSLEMVDLIIEIAPENYPFNYSNILTNAARGGNLEIVDRIAKIIPKSYQLDYGGALYYSNHDNRDIFNRIYEIADNRSFYKNIFDYEKSMSDILIGNAIRKVELSYQMRVYERLIKNL